MAVDASNRDSSHQLRGLQVAEGWKTKYGGLEVSEAKRLRQLGEENRQLKQLVAEMTLDNGGAEGGAVKKW